MKSFVPMPKAECFNGVIETAQLSILPRPTRTAEAERDKLASLTRSSRAQRKGRARGCHSDRPRSDQVYRRPAKLSLELRETIAKQRKIRSSAIRIRPRWSGFSRGDPGSQLR